MDQPANTVSYFVAGYVVIFGAMIAYLVSLVVRWRNLRQDEEVLQQIEAEQQPTEKARAH